jgi:putative permease
VSGQRDSLYHTLARVLYLALGIVVLAWFVVQTGTILLASLLALILAVALNAPVTWLEGRNVSRGLGLALTFGSVVLVSAVVGWLVVPRLLEEIPALIEEIPAIVTDVGRRISEVLGGAPEVERQMERGLDWAMTAAGELWRYAGAAAGAFVMTIFVIALVLFMVGNMRTLLAWYVRSIPVRHRRPATRAFARGSRMVIGWLYASVIVGVIKAVAAASFLTLMGVPGAIVWSVLAFFAAFIPRIGFYMMTLPPVLVAFSVDPMTALWTLIFYVVAPRIFAETMELNAVFILFMTVALGFAFGLVGVLIATPVAGFIKAYYDEFYMARMPEEPEMELHVAAMMERDASRIDPPERRQAGESAGA